MQLTHRTTARLSSGSGRNWLATTSYLFAWTQTGSQAAPVRDLTIRGLEIRDTAYTYLGTDKADLHGMPSGGEPAIAS